MVLMLRHCYGALERRFEGGIFSPLCDRGYDREGYQYRLRQAGMRSREDSLVLSLLERAKRYLLDTSVASFGWLFLLTGIFFLTGALLFEGTGAEVGAGSVSFVLILCSLPLCTSMGSLARAVRKSYFCSRFLFDFCAFSPDGFLGAERGRSRVGGALLLSIALALAALVLTPVGCACGAFVLFCLFVLFALPELNLLLLVLVFPFLQLSSHPTVLLCILALVIELSFLTKVLFGKRELFFSLCDFLVLLFCLSLFLGGLFGEGSPFEGLVLSLLAGIYFPATHLLQNEKWRRAARTCSAFSGGITAWIGILQYALGRAEIRWVDATRFGDIGGRVTSVFDNPNILAIYLLFTFPLALYGAFDSKETTVGRLRFGFFGGGMLLCLLLTWTRGAWLGLLVVGLLFLLLHSRRTLAVACLSPLPLLALCSFFPSEIYRRFASIADLAESSIRYRLYTWQGVMRMIRAHPFGIGVGSRAFLSVYPRYAVSGTETVMHAHNLLLQITAEMGVPVLGLFCTLLALVFLRSLGEGEDSGAGLGIMAVLVMGAFDHLWYSPGLIGLFFFTLAMTKKEKGARI
ncbi:MAG: O-antigen ligase family protein [Clostridia bacterium]|nr:O-antigen ligase family protein [Clostridia bacterium]